MFEARKSPQLETRMLCLGKDERYEKVMPNFPKIIYAYYTSYNA